MARADKNDLNRSRIESERNQREEQPTVAGAEGGLGDHSPEAAEQAARRRVGKTRRHTGDDRPGA